MSTITATTMTGRTYSGPHGNVSMAHGRHPLSLANSIRTGDVIELAKIPIGARVYGHQAYWEALGTGVTLNIGIKADGGGEALPTFFATSLDASSAGSQVKANELKTLTSAEYAVYATVTVADQVTNGAFAADSDWTKGAGWTIGSGVATRAASASTPTLTQDISAVNGRTYEVKLDLTVTAGTSGITVAINGGTASAALTADGSYTLLLVAGASGTLTITAGADYAGTIDNVTAGILPVGDLEVSAFYVSEGI